MSIDSGGPSSGSAASSTAPCDIPTATNAAQETTHDVAKSCVLYSSLSPSSAATRESLCVGCNQSGIFSLASSSIRANEDGQEHPNKDAKQYSQHSSEESCLQVTLEQLPDTRTSPQTSSGEDADLPMPVQAEGTSDSDNEKSSLEMVVTKDSLFGSFLVIQKRPRDEINSILVDQTTSEGEASEPFFPMDDDNEPTGLGAEFENSPEVCNLTSQLHLNSATDDSESDLSRESFDESVDNEDGKPRQEDDLLVPESEATSMMIDVADVHRDPAIRVMNKGECVTRVNRKSLCLAISGCRPQIDFSLRRLDAGDIKGECVLHAQGLDEDYTDRKVTVTGIIRLPKDARKASSLYANPNCTIKLSAYIYEGPIERNVIIGQGTEARKLSEDEREKLIMHMTVHNVASQVDIIFQRSCEKVFVRVTAEILH